MSTRCFPQSRSVHASERSITDENALACHPCPINTQYYYILRERDRLRLTPVAREAAEAVGGMLDEPAAPVASIFGVDNSVNEAVGADAAARLTFCADSWSDGVVISPIRPVCVTLGMAKSSSQRFSATAGDPLSTCEKGEVSVNPATLQSLLGPVTTSEAGPEVALLVMMGLLDLNWLNRMLPVWPHGTVYACFPARGSAQDPFVDFTPFAGRRFSVKKSANATSGAIHCGDAGLAQEGLVGGSSLPHLGLHPGRASSGSKNPTCSSGIIPWYRQLPEASTS